MNSGFAGRRKQVESALLEYQRAPGQYPLLLRRPEILFASIREILQLASGRMPDGAAPPSPAVQRAASFFVRSTLLHPAADHYALLGLERSANAAEIKERYRQVMRLMHPDFASTAVGGSWPADAASRINQAYEVLASEAQRRSYDDKLNPAAAPAVHRPPVAQSAAQLKAAANSAPAQDPRRLLKRMAGAFGALAAVAMAASLLARGPDRESLVQRAAPRSAPTISPMAQSDTRLPSVAALVEQAPAVQLTLVAASEPPMHAAFAAPFAPPPRSEPQRSDPGAVSPSTVLPVAIEMPPARLIAVSSDAAAMPLPPPAPQFAQTSPQTPVPTPPPRPNPAAAVTVAEAHVLLSLLLQQMESGSGERLLSGLDRNARNAPAAQALARQYNGAVDGARSIKVANVQMRAEPREDRLLVKGQVVLEIGEHAAMRVRELSLEAEFARRNGAIVMTRLAPAQGGVASGQ